MHYLKSLLKDFQTRRPSSTVEEFKHPALDVIKNDKYLGNVCPFYVISTIKTDYNGNEYQDLVLYDSTGEGPIYSEKRYFEPIITPKKWFDEINKLPNIRFRISYLAANYLEEE